MPFLKCKTHPEATLQISKRDLAWLKEHATNHCLEDIFDIVE